MEEQARRRIVVHVGYSKCGSTTIQETMAANRELLLSNGILFPEIVASNPAWLRFFWEKNLPTTYDNDVVRRRKDIFLKELGREVAQSEARTIFLSDEGLISLNEESVSQFSAFLTKEYADFDVSILVLVREPIAFLTSRCQQFISNRYFTMADVQAYLDGKAIINGESRADNIAMNPTWLFSGNIIKFQRHFDEVLVFSFENGVKFKGGMTSYLLGKLGCEIEVTDFHENASRSDKAISIIDFINTMFPFRAGNRRNSLRYFDDLGLLYSLSGEKFRLPESLISQLSKTTADEVKWLSEHFGIDYSGFPQTASSPICWGDEFVKEMIEIFPRLNVLYRQLVYLFISERLLETKDAESKANLSKIKTWIEKEHPMLVVSNFRLLVMAQKVYTFPVRFLRKRRKWVKSQLLRHL